MLKFQQLTLRRGPKPLFEDASFNIHPGQKVGLTGANGCGKSSLLALIRGELSADHGDFHCPAQWVIAHVAQETAATTCSALDFTLDGDHQLRALQTALTLAQEAGQGDRAAQIFTELENIGAYQASSRAAALLHGLGFNPGEEQRPVSSFSGGWRMRLNLAQALMCRSDLLLLDEPTNHLDLEAVIWLEEWLRSYPGTLLLISHDREFLDSTVTHIAHIEQGRLTFHKGNYSAFEQIRTEQLAQQQANYDRQQREIAHIHKFVDRFRAKASKARQAQSRLKALERMERIAAAHIDSPFHFQIPAPDKKPNPLISLEQAVLGYGDTAIVKTARLVINSEDRIGLLGHNGAGKSTLIRTLAGEQPLLAGVMHCAQDLKIGYFAQHQLEQLHGQQTPLDHLRQIAPQQSEQSLRDFLGGFGFGGDQATMPVEPFSGGEKARLVLALLVYQRPNLLLLDEPTNHLDLEMRQALAIALQNYEGAMLLVSHDRHLLRNTADQLWLVHSGTIEDFPGSVDDYPIWLAQQQRSIKCKEEKALGDHNAAIKKERKRQEAEQRKRLQPLRNQLQKLEKELDRFHVRQQQLAVELGSAELYQEPQKTKLKGLLLEKGEVDQQVALLEEQWLELSESLEMASKEES